MRIPAPLLLAIFLAAAAAPATCARIVNATPVEVSSAPHLEPAGWRLAVAPYATPHVTPAGWSGVGSGVNQAVEAIAVDESTGAVYVAGHFTIAGGLSTTPAQYLVAKWDGAAWTALGGANDWVFSLAVDGGVVYAGGRFTQIGGVSATRIAYYDPQAGTWSAIGVGFNNPVQAIAVGPDGCLYAAGGFRIVGDASGQNLARTCVEEVWEYVGGGTDNTVYDLAFAGDVLYIAGAFNRVGTGAGMVARQIAAFDLATRVWSPVGQGVTQVGGGPVLYTVGIGPEGHVYVGGAFDSIGGVTTSALARWDGVAWHAVGGGLVGATGGSTSVRDLAFDGAGHLYVGGSFTEAGGTAARSVARWTGAAWEALDVGVGNGVVLALGVSTRFLYAGGGFSDMGGAADLDYLARWEGVVGVSSEPGAGGPPALALDAAAPNPFEHAATLRFSVGRAQAVRLELFDALGRRVGVLFDGTAAAGQPVEVRVDGQSLPAGRYLARLTSEDGVATRALTRAR